MNVPFLPLLSFGPFTDVRGEAPFERFAGPDPIRCVPSSDSYGEQSPEEKMGAALDEGCRAPVAGMPRAPAPNRVQPPEQASDQTMQRTIARRT
jgi:hypothetical protein